MTLNRNYLLILLLLFLIFFIIKHPSLIKSDSNYDPPSFFELNKSEGKLSFGNRWKSSGGYVLLYLDDGSKLILSCTPPGSNVDNSCYKKRKSKNEWVDYRKNLTGKNATAWWRAEEDTLERKMSGRVYKLEVDGWKYFDFNEIVNYYLNNNKKINNSAMLFWFVILYSEYT